MGFTLTFVVYFRSNTSQLACMYIHEIMCSLWQSTITIINSDNENHFAEIWGQFHKYRILSRPTIKLDSINMLLELQFLKLIRSSYIRFQKQTLTPLN